MVQIELLGEKKNNMENLYLYSNKTIFKIVGQITDEKEKAKTYSDIVEYHSHVTAGYYTMPLLEEFSLFICEDISESNRERKRLMVHKSAVKHRSMEFPSDEAALLWFKLNC